MILDLRFSPQRVKAIRAKLGLTQVEFAARLGCSQPILSQWETGTHTPRDTGYLMALLELEGEAEQG